MPAASSRPELWKLVLTQQKTIKTNPQPPKKGCPHELLLYTVTARNRPIILSLKKAEGQLIYSDKISLLKIILNFFVSKDHLF